MAGIHLTVWQLWLFVFKFPAYQNDMEFSNFVFKTIDVRFVFKNHAFQSSLLLKLTTFLSTGENFLKIELHVLPE